MRLLFEHGTVLTMASPSEAPFEGFVGIDGNRIVLVTRNASEAAQFRDADPSVRVIDARGKLLMPGLINTHCHAAMTLQRSYADDIALMEWLHDYIWPFEAKQTPEEILTGFELGVAEMLTGGVTSFVDMYFSEDRCVDVARRTGIRALLGPCYFDSNIDQIFPEIERAVKYAEGCSRVKVAVGIHSPYTVTPDNILRGKKLAQQLELPIMIHISETQQEVEIIREQYGKTTIEHLDALGLLDDSTIGAHCIYVSDSDIATLVKRGVAISHNPQSNMKISSGVAPIEKMRHAEALLTIGTDGPCSNNDLDMWEEMRTASFLQKSYTGSPCAVPAYEILKMATVNGAKAMGHGDELGVVREGALADVILIDLQKPHLQPIHNLVANLVYCGKAADVEIVVVDGQIVVENHSPVHIDLPNLYTDAATAVRRITGK